MASVLCNYFVDNSIITFFKLCEAFNLLQLFELSVLYFYTSIPLSSNAPNNKKSHIVLLNV